jgi:hypothetical protein
MTVIDSSCPGALVTHLGGKVAFCTEENAGREGPGYKSIHANPPELCWRKAREDACSICDA